MVYAGDWMRQDGIQDDTRRGSGTKATVSEAAAALGVTVDAIRKRIQRGTIPHERHEDGRVYVLLDAASNLQDNDRDGYRTTRDELVESLHEQVKYLKDVVATRDEEIRRRDHIIAGLVERMPELPPASPREPRDGRVTASDGQGGEEPGPATGGAQEGAEQRSWLYRFFFGP